jgi:hypothetical protein
MPGGAHVHTRVVETGAGRGALDRRPHWPQWRGSSPPPARPPARSRGSPGRVGADLASPYNRQIWPKRTRYGGPVFSSANGHAGPAFRFYTHDAASVVDLLAMQSIFTLVASLPPRSQQQVSVGRQGERLG